METKDIKYGKEKRMQNWLGVLISVMPVCPQLYPGYLMPEENGNLGTLRIGVSAGWILLIICIPVLVLVYILFWKGAWFHKRKRVDHK
jgi:hypothetical protein